MAPLSFGERPPPPTEAASSKRPAKRNGPDHSLNSRPLKFEAIIKKDGLRRSLGVGGERAGQNYSTAVYSFPFHCSALLDWLLDSWYIFKSIVNFWQALINV